MKNNKKNLKKDITYEQLMISTFAVLIDCFGIDKAIIILYELNKYRGKKI